MFKFCMSIIINYEFDLNNLKLPILKIYPINKLF